MSENLPNLDSLSAEELWEFWKKTNSVRPIAFARELFPDAPTGYVRATKDLGCYASNKATAVKCRLDGQISAALMYEAICDRIFENLPAYAKW